MQELERKLSYVFRNSALLSTALSHSSYVNENRELEHKSNERFEFLGDAVLGQVVASHLFLSYPDMPEGQMTRVRAELVCEQSLYSAAMSLDLGKYLKLGKGEERSGGRQRPSILADAIEAIIAAMYLDGGITIAEEFIKKNILSDIDIFTENQLSDYKTALQEHVQRKPNQLLTYESIAESGPDHKKTFTVHVLLNGRAIGEGKGRTKKEAEQYAAKSGLAEITK